MVKADWLGDARTEPDGSTLTLHGVLDDNNRLVAGRPFYGEICKEGRLGGLWPFKIERQPSTRDCSLVVWGQEVDPANSTLTFSDKGIVNEATFVRRDGPNHEWTYKITSVGDFVTLSGL